MTLTVLGDLHRHSGSRRRFLALVSLMDVKHYPLAAPEAVRNGLQGKRIHLWAVRLDPPQKQVDALARLVDPQERARADRFRFEKHRRRFLVGRGALRRLLGAYLGRDPAALQFVYGDKGKPFLADPPAGETLHFNLSNSSDLALIGLNRRREIGVDVERLRPLSDLAQVAERFFSAGESRTLLELPEENQQEGFFNCWTRKEAYLKAVGDGLTAPLNRFDVTLRPGEAPKMLSLEGSEEKAASWTLHHLFPQPGYLGAVAIEEDGWSFDAWSWRG